MKGIIQEIGQSGKMLRAEACTRAYICHDIFYTPGMEIRNFLGSRFFRRPSKWLGTELQLLWIFVRF